MHHRQLRGFAPPCLTDGVGQNIMNLIRLFYVSKASGTIAKSDISDILEKSRKNNESLGLSGVLCLKTEYFAQILEGEELNVLRCYIKIAQDKRHSDLVIVSISTTFRRVFEGWAMGCIGDEMTTAINIDDILKFRNSAQEQPDSGMLMQRWLKLLESQSGLTRR